MFRLNVAPVWFRPLIKSVIQAQRDRLATLRASTAPMRSGDPLTGLQNFGMVITTLPYLNLAIAKMEDRNDAAGAELIAEQIALIALSQALPSPPAIEVDRALLDFLRREMLERHRAAADDAWWQYHAFRQTGAQTGGARNLKRFYSARAEAAKQGKRGKDKADFIAERMRSGPHPPNMIDLFGQNSPPYDILGQAQTGLYTNESDSHLAQLTDHMTSRMNVLQAGVGGSEAAFGAMAATLTFLAAQKGAISAGVLQSFAPYVGTTGGATLTSAAGALAGSVSVVLLAAIIGTMEGFRVVNDTQFEDKLNAAKSAVAGDLSLTKLFTEFPGGFWLAVYSLVPSIMRYRP